MALPPSPTGPAAAPAFPPEDAVWWERLRDPAQAPAAKEALVERYLALVKAEAGRMARHLPRHLDREELYAEGVVGLLSAIEHFDPAQGVLFSAYARKRIWGAMMDRLRSLDGIPRSSRQAARRLAKALNRFQNEYGRQPGEEELAEALGASREELHELERQAGLAQTLSLDAGGLDADDLEAGTLAEQLADESAPACVPPLDRLEQEELKGRIVQGLLLLPERERIILVLYYQQNLMLKEIAETLAVSESRISQLHNRALLRLRAYLEKTRISITEN